MSGTAAQDTSVPVGYEVGLLHAMASAQTQAEQRRLRAELESHRTRQSAALREQRSLDLAGAVVATRHPTTEVSQSTRHTSATDWLGEVEPDTHDLTDVTQQATAAASTWFAHRMAPEVVDHPEELQAQAVGMAGRQASRFGLQASAARRAFLDQVARLYNARTGRCVNFTLPRWADATSQAPPGSSLPPGVDNAETFDDVTLPEDEAQTRADPTAPGDTPSLSEGSEPAGDTDQGVTNPAAGQTHDAGPGPGTTPSVDYLDGHRTPPTNSSGATTLSSRHVADVEPNGGYRVEIRHPNGARVTHHFPGYSAGLSAAKRWAEDGHRAGASTAQVVRNTDGAVVYDPHRGTDLTNLTWDTEGRRHTADTVMPSDRGGDTPSLEEGGPVGGDQEPTGQPVADATTHDAGPGNGPTIDYLDAQRYPWPGAAALRPISVLAAQVELAETRVGRQLPPAARSYLLAMQALTTTDDTYGGVPATQVVGYFLRHARVRNPASRPLMGELAAHLRAGAGPPFGQRPDPDEDQAPPVGSDAPADLSPDSPASGDVQPDQPPPALDPVGDVPPEEELPSWEVQAVQGLDPDGLRTLRQTLVDIGWGDTPLGRALGDDVKRREAPPPPVSSPAGPVSASRQTAVFRQRVQAGLRARRSTPVHAEGGPDWCGSHCRGPHYGDPGQPPPPPLWDDRGGGSRGWQDQPGVDPREREQ